MLWNVTHEIKNNGIFQKYNFGWEEPKYLNFLQTYRHCSMKNYHYIFNNTNWVSTSDVICDHRNVHIHLISGSMSCPQSHLFRSHANRLRRNNYRATKTRIVNVRFLICALRDIVFYDWTKSSWAEFHWCCSAYIWSRLCILEFYCGNFGYLY